MSGFNMKEQLRDLLEAHVVDCFTDEGHVLQREESNVSPEQLSSAAQRMLCLPIEGTLTENGAKHATVWQQVLDLPESFEARMSR